MLSISYGQRYFVCNNDLYSMENNSNKNDGLGYMGEEYQTQLLKCLIEDYLFFIKINPVLDQNKFTLPSLKRIIGIMKDLYSEHGCVPTYVDLKNWIRYNIKNDIAVKEMVALLYEAYNIKNFNINIVESSAIDFFKQQNLAYVLKKAEEMLKKGNVHYDIIEKMLQEALELQNVEDTSFRLFDNIDDDLKEDYRKTIPTGAVLLDKALSGGLARGELGVIIAPLSVGKTSSVTGFAANAALYKCKDNNFKGYKVFHCFFEDVPVNIRRKYYGFVTGFDASILSRPEIKSEVKKILSEKKDVQQLLKENIVLERMESGERSATDIDNEIKRQIALGFKPDLVIIDYFECLKPEPDTKFADTEWSREGITMRKLESMANKYNIAIWVPIQGRKDSIGAEYVGVAQGGGSVKKTQIGHVIITFAQTDEQKIAGTMNIFIGKFRGGKIIRNKFLGVKFNNGTCKFDFSGMEDANEETDTDFTNISNSVSDLVKNIEKNG